MLHRAGSFFGSGAAEDIEAKEARERLKRAQRLQQRRSQTVQVASRLLPRSPQSTSFSIFDNAPPVAANATEFDKEFETRGKGRRQMNPMGEVKQRETSAEDDKIDRLAAARGINRAQAKVLLAQNSGLKASAKAAQQVRPDLTAFRSQSSTSSTTSASSQSQARQQVYAPQPRYVLGAPTKTVNIVSPGPQATSPRFYNNVQTPPPRPLQSATSSPHSSYRGSSTQGSPPRPTQSATSSPRSSYRGSPAQQLVRSASEESIPVAPEPRIVPVASPSLPALDFSSPRSAPSPPSLLRNQISPVPSLSAFGMNKSIVSPSIDATAANYSFSSSKVPNDRYGFGDSLPAAQVTTVGGLRTEHEPQAYNESMIYDVIARAL